MPAPTITWLEKNNATVKEPRYVIVQSFAKDGSDQVSFTGSADTAVAPGATKISSVISKRLSGTSQRLNVDQARSELGAMAAQLIDRDGQITDLINQKLTAGDSLAQRKAEFYVGYDGLSWDDYALIGTQLVRDYKLGKGVIPFRYADIQRGMQDDIFDLQESFLTASIGEADTTIPIPNTTKFEMVAHGTSFSDATSQTVGYIKIDDEVIRYTGKIPGEFTGCTRGALGTRPAEHTIDETGKRKTAVHEYAYLELPAIKMALLLMLGTYDGITLPAGWHLGMDPLYVRESDFENIGADLWNLTNDDEGRVLFFPGLKKQSGKKFIEEKLLFTSGVFHIVHEDGAMGLRRMAKIGPDAATSATLGVSDIVAYEDLHHDLESALNRIVLRWNYSTREKRTNRTTALIDNDSILKYQPSKKEVELLGLHGSRHSASHLQAIFEQIHERFAQAPYRWRIKVKHKWNRLQVGEVIRVVCPHVKDVVGGGTIDRAFEVQGKQVDWVTGQVWLTLFGSTGDAGVYVPDSATIIDDGHAETIGVNIGTALTVTDVDGVGHVTANGALAGAVSMAAGAYHHVGDLIIDSGMTVDITQNVLLVVEGHLTVNGDINGVGSGLPGGVGSTAIVTDLYGNASDGQVGGFGSTASQQGMYVRYVSAITLDGPRMFTHYVNNGSVKGNLSAVNSAIAAQDVRWDGSGLVGLPSDLRGTSGSGGGLLARINGLNPVEEFLGAGGVGGAGGAGLIIICRGLSFGAGGGINLSGADGGVGAGPVQMTPGGLNGYAGAGAGGSPGGLLVVLDGSNSNYPDLNPSVFTARNGVTPIRGAIISPGAGGYALVKDHQGEASGVFHQNNNLSGVDRFGSAKKVMYLPDFSAPEPDVNTETVIPPASMNLPQSGTAHLRTAGDGTQHARVYGSITASTDPLLKGYEWAYQINGGDWVTQSSRNDPSTLWVYVLGAKEGDSIVLRCRAVNRFDKTSAWVITAPHVVLGKEDPPPDVTGLLVHMTGDGLVSARWDQVDQIAVPDFSHYEFRYGPQNDALGWDDATPINDRLDANRVVGDVPPGAKRFFVKMKDTSKIASVNAAQYDMTVTSAFDVIQSVDQQPDWLGTLDGFEKTLSGGLAPMQKVHSNQLTEGELFGQNWVVYPVATCTYTSPVIDLSFIGPVRIWGDIDSHLGPGQAGIANPQLQVRVSDDNITWTAWQNWESDIVTTRYVQYQLILDTTQGPSIIDAMQAVADAQEWKQKIKGVAVGAGSTSVVFAKQHHNPPFVRIYPVGDATLQVSYDPASVTGQGFDVLADKAGIVDIETEGV
jgi:hypothetical protein